MEKDRLIFLSNKKPNNIFETKAGKLNVCETDEDYEDYEYMEYVKSSNDYYDLENIKDWRKMFSNLYISTFILDGLKWNTVKQYSEETLWHLLLKKPIEEKASTNHLISSGISNKNYMIPALLAKFTQNSLLKKTLLATGNADLYFFSKRITKGSRVQLWSDLMYIRKYIKRFDSTRNLIQESKISLNIINKIFHNTTPCIKSESRKTLSCNSLIKLLPTLPVVVIKNIISKFVGNPFIIMVNVLDSITIPRIHTDSFFIIDWGDSTSQVFYQKQKTISHEYQQAGEYIISIDGNIKGIDFNGVKELVEITQWGIAKINRTKTFSQCKNLTSISAIDKPDLSGITDLSFMFCNCSMLSYANLNGWDMSNVTDTGFMFSGCKSLIVDLSKWNVGNVTDMTKMFQGCTLFNSDLSSWDTSNVTDMTEMFAKCESFNNDISQWNVSKVIIMYGMFRGCVLFNSDISKWNVENVINMAEMFFECYSFDRHLSRWNISNVEDMTEMFHGCVLVSFDMECDYSNGDNE